ncbi:MAG: PAC2 family protein [Candidatus Hodarchaeota archaeon]
MMYINIIKKFDLKVEEIHNPVVLIGWPGIALVAKLAITSIKDSIKAKEFLSIEYFDFPPKSNVEKGKLEIPTAEVYYKSRPGKKENDLFILTANYQPQTPEGVFEFSQKFCEEMDKITEGKIIMYVSTGAMVSDKIRDEPMVHVCGTDQEVVKSFLKQKDTKVMDGGVIAGANGILPAWAGQKGFAPGVCLLAETLPLPMMALDPRASKALVTILRDYFNIEMGFEELDKKIEEMESVIESYKKQAEHFMKGVREDREPDSYFR